MLIVEGEPNVSEGGVQLLNIPKVVQWIKVYFQVITCGQHETLCALMGYY